MEQKQMDTLFEKIYQAFNTRIDEIKEEFTKQTNILTENFSKCMKTTLEDKLNPIMEENKKLKNEGKRESKKRRPVMIKLTLAWRRLAILQNNKHFTENIYATEDFPKDILQIRNELKQKQQEEIKKGNLAFIRYDKLIIKERTNQKKGHEKRKRSPLKTPKHTYHNKAGDSQTAPKKINKINTLEFMSRSRTNSESDNNNQ
ncbi:unnamed protein product [Euphydryas editha]|uniref:Endonuclease-reverse transcriptase n=1 Tax=Euphydryas editha TaxID=104508 RepID=A0AAU9TZS5_EUPED|nr:unnamed protein product [Euphydryas editha]